METKTKFFITLGIGILLIAGFFFATQSITKFTGHAVLTDDNSSLNSSSSDSESDSGPVSSGFLTGSITGSAVGSNSNNQNSLAKCLSEKGAKMYGAYWCPHCQDQEIMFGGLKVLQDNNLYVECDANGDNANPTACSQAGIEGYPTWVIGGKKYAGAQSLDKLKQLSGC